MKTTRLHGFAAALLLSACVPDGPPFVLLSDVPQLMATVVEPAADVYWDAVGWIIDEYGEVEFSPSTDEEWEAVRNAAVVVAESGNLLMMEGRALNQGTWMDFSRAMITAAQRAIEAAEARDKLAVFDEGAEIYYTCTACHAAYALETLRPSAVVGR